MMRWSSILSEAWRNTVSGTSRAVVFAAALTALVGGLATAQTLHTGSVMADAQRWHDAGASVHIVTAQGSIDGEQCEALASIPGVRAAGAVRAGDPMTLAALPSNELATLEASPGFGKVVQLRQNSVSPSGGVWMSSDLAEDLAADGSPQSAAVRTSEGGTVTQEVPIAGVYRHTEDGRAPLLARTIVTPVLARGSFDSCWVDVWPESKEIEQLITAPVRSNGDHTPEPQHQLLNSSLGTRFDLPGRLNAIPSWAVLAAAVALGFVVGVVFARRRQLEAASALHAGVDKASLVVQMTVEFVYVTIATVIVCSPVMFGLSFVAAFFTPPLFTMGTAVVAAGCLAGLVGTVATSVRFREDKLFDLFKTR